MDLAPYFRTIDTGAASTFSIRGTSKFGNHIRARYAQHVTDLLHWSSFGNDGERDGVTSTERERVKALGREAKVLRRDNQILEVASAFLAQADHDRRMKS